MSQFVLCITATVLSTFSKKVCMFLQILRSQQGHENADASPVVKNLSVMRSRHIFARIQSSKPIAVALPCVSKASVQNER